MKPIEHLQREHGLIRLLLSAYEKHIEAALGTGRLNVDTSKDFLKIMRRFVSGSHMLKEDRHLTPKLYEAGVSRDYGPLLVLGEEHSRIQDEFAFLLDLFNGLYSGNISAKPRY